MGESIVQLGLWQLLAAYGFVLLVLGLARYAGIQRSKMIILAAMRMTLQLILVGYVLIYVFDNPAPIITLLILTVMEVFAIFNIYKRTGIRQEPVLQRSLAIAMVAGTGLCMVYFLLAVLVADPWYNPQYVVPLGGMIVGNSMTALSLCANRLLADLRANRAQIEGMLMLGARPKRALDPLLKAAFDASLLPTINSMVGMGIVFLPGLMTGQILSGVSPLVAIGYQIIMMLSILASVALSVFIFLQLSVRAFFNEDAQLVFEREGRKKPPS